ncbi:hypothetical protein BKH43_04165 [Helicobacter sp. 13S00401-1]|uniref:hypothetical protein n=1 Tax=Helicobacter sp. 13S00401-1 TaxID=1905758 RepID=UPI000BA6548E|nr:hypothetical protein [Helicobacter sp. 13S00401-1]PAF50758.1 hypothetical protein BKH43_04165 [Helicobacter sp. 13S00401-1]
MTMTIITLIALLYIIIFLLYWGISYLVRRSKDIFTPRPKSFKVFLWIFYLAIVVFIIFVFFATSRAAWAFLDISVVYMVAYIIYWIGSTIERKVKKITDKRAKSFGLLGAIFLWAIILLIFSIIALTTNAFYS